MPIFDFRCKACGHGYEQLVRSSTVLACPACGSADVEKQVSAPAPQGQITGLISRARTQAAREGHFSNYKKSELRGKVK
jgi:putative FmdB family regulatory protein